VNVDKTASAPDCPDLQSRVRLPTTSGRRARLEGQSHHPRCRLRQRAQLLSELCMANACASAETRRREGRAKFERISCMRRSHHSLSRKQIVDRYGPHAAAAHYAGPHGMLRVIPCRCASFTDRRLAVEPTPCAADPRAPTPARSAQPGTPLQQVSLAKNSSSSGQQGRAAICISCGRSRAKAMARTGGDRIRGASKWRTSTPPFARATRHGCGARLALA